MKILCVLEAAPTAVARATGIMIPDSPKKCKRKVKKSMFGLVSVSQSVNGGRFKKKIKLNEEIKKERKIYEKNENTTKKLSLKYWLVG